MKDTILESLNKKDKEKLKEYSDQFSKTIEDILITNFKDKLSFDFVFDKVYETFTDPILCEMIFDKLQDSLEHNHGIDMRQKDI